jgi:acetyltransferase
MRSEALAVLEQVRSENTEYHVKRLLSLYGIPVVKEFVATSAEDAVRAAAEIGYPVALKILSPQIRHKTESGGVRLGLRNPDEVRGAYEDILASVRWLNPEARITGVLVQEMVTGGFEVILGGTNDPQFGPVIMFGSGGVLVELLRDTVYRLPPLTYSEALDLLKRFRGAPILGGFRGRPALDEAALAEALVRFSELVSDLSAHIREVEINPLVVLEKGRGVRALDALLNPA